VSEAPFLLRRVVLLLRSSRFRQPGSASVRPPLYPPPPLRKTSSPLLQSHHLGPKLRPYSVAVAVVVSMGYVMRWVLPFTVAALVLGSAGCFTLAKRGLVEFEQRKQRSRNLQLPADCNPTELSPVPEGQRPTLAVIDMDAGVRLPPDSGRAMADLCRAVVHDSGQYALIDREHVVDILGEQDFAAAVQCDSTKCLVQYGRMLGV